MSETEETVQIAIRLPADINYTIDEIVVARRRKQPKDEPRITKTALVIEALNDFILKERTGQRAE